MCWLLSIHSGRTTSRYASSGASMVMAREPTTAASALWPEAPGQGRPEPRRADATQTDVAGAHEGRKRGEGVGQAGEGRVTIDAGPTDRRRGAVAEPGLELNVADVETALGPLTLGVDATEEAPVVEDRQRVVAVDALGARR